MASGSQICGKHGRFAGTAHEDQGKSPVRGADSREGTVVIVASSLVRILLIRVLMSSDLP